ncbi:MAG: major facilitator superfamily 1 [Frankiales bacterium]|nr:major facilitator superfamily 1 [Frankiales bacterium]
MSPAPARQAGPAEDEAYTPDPRRWKALAVCLVVGFMTLLDVSIVNVALPSIASSLGAGDSALQWIVSGYALTFGLLLVPAGRFGDARGRRQAFLLGLVLFVLASLACGLAPSSGWLVGARLLQGFAGGLLTPQVSGLVQQLFRGAERARAFAALGASIGLSTAVGPVVGGLLIAGAGEDLGWRLVFVVNLPIGVVALLLALRLLPADPGGSKRYDTDPVGVLLLGAGVGSLLLALIQGGLPWLYPVGVLLLATWVLWERRYARSGEPLVDLALFRRAGYSSGALVAVLFFAGFTGSFFIYSLHLQGELEYGALGAGAAFLPFALGSAAAALAGGRLVTRLGRPVVVAGLVLAVLGFAGTWVAAQLVPGRGLVWAAAVPLLVAGVGSGLVITPNITLTLSQVPVRGAGTAGGVLQTGQRIGAAAGIAVTGSVFTSRLAGSGDSAAAFRAGLLVITGLVAAALVVAVVDAVRGRAAV